MKLWRKMAMKEGKDVQRGTRPGRSIKRGMQMQEAAFKTQPKMYPLLAQLLVHAQWATIGTVTPEVTNEVVA